MNTRSLFIVKGYEYEIYVVADNLADVVGAIDQHLDSVGWRGQRAIDSIERVARGQGVCVV